jgi:uncharacterized protein YcfL
MRQTIHSSMLFLPLVMMLGCGSNSQSNDVLDSAILPQVTLLDPELREQITIGEIITTRDGSNLLHVEIPLRSTTDLSFVVDYRITFLDRNIIPLNPSARWITLPLRPNFFQNLELTSNSTRATDFRIEFRDAR